MLGITSNMSFYWAIVCIILGFNWFSLFPLDIVSFAWFFYSKHSEACRNLAFAYITAPAVVRAGVTISIVFISLQVYKFIKALQVSSTSTDDFPIKPMLFPCQTSHTRLFPTKRSFSYSYLLAGVPVGWKGSVGGMLSADVGHEQTPWYLRWFSPRTGGAWHVVDEGDYLGRGHSKDGLEGKLRDYLQSKGIDYKLYPYAYLLTAPRFLNYSSNPVSIWHLYSPSKNLAALILEVNNTFDERHIYFLTPSMSQPLDKSKSPRFSDHWPKDFYVSVFNSRAGAYSLSASDPFFPSMTGTGPIKTTITLSSSESHPKLIASVFSTAPGIDPTTMSTLSKTSFLLTWWWVGLATFPRTVYQALTILIKHKLPWVFRPEPRLSTLPRAADPTEALVATLFARYLRHGIETSPTAVKLHYTPAGISDTEPETMLSPSAQFDPTAEEPSLKVRTPLFYSRLIHYPDLSSALLAEPSTITPSAPFPALTSTSSPTSIRSPYSLKWKLLPYLRRIPAPIVNADEAPPSPAAYSTKRGYTDFEAFILTHASAEEQDEYVQRAFRMFLGERVAFGWPEILDLEGFLLRAMFVRGIVSLT